MILYNAVNAKFGSTDISEIRFGSNLVWSGETDAEGIWEFPDPTTGDNIVLTATFSGSCSAHWGDGNSDSLTSDTEITHTYS